MNTANLDQYNQQKWSELLTQAVTQPGLILKAHTAFYGYSLDNRFAALVQCQIRAIEPGPIDTLKDGRKKADRFAPVKRPCGFVCLSLAREPRWSP